MKRDFAFGPRTVLLALGALACVACGGDDEPAGPGGPGPDSSPDVGAGATAIVAILNPTANEGHNTGVPGSLGGDREGVLVDAEPGESDLSEDGIAVVGVPAGPVDLAVGDATISLTVQADGDVYDAPIAFSGSGASFFDATPIRYPVGQASGAFFFDVDASFSDITAKLSEDDVVVVLGPGVYRGDLVITGKGVLLFGEGFLERSVVIDGSVTANGEEVRLRGVTVTGDLAAKGNNFGISFSVVEGKTEITGNGGAFVRNVFCGETKVPSSNATLLDNYGVAPLGALPLGVCD